MMTRTLLRLAISALIGAWCAATPLQNPVISAHAQTAIYYCAVGTTSSGGIKTYPSPQPGLQCFTNQADAEHASSPYFFCVTGGPDAWKITAYTEPQAGQTCYETVEQAELSLPPNVTQLRPPGGSVSAQACSVAAPLHTPPGSVYFVRCTSGMYATVIHIPDTSSSATPDQQSFRAAVRSAAQRGRFTFRTLTALYGCALWAPGSLHGLRGLAQVRYC